MAETNYGYYGRVLELDLTNGTSSVNPVPAEDLERFLGGRGLGIKLLWDRLSAPGVDPLSPENPLVIMTSPLSGLPVPAASLVCCVTKSPHTSPHASEHPNASTMTYSNLGGFFGPEIRFAGYDGIVITGKASTPLYVVIDDDRIEFRDAAPFWGMGTDAFERRFFKELGDPRFSTCYIGQAGENRVEYACVMNTAGRAFGRGGVGCVMGSKNLKAIAVRGSRIPAVHDHKRFLELLEKGRKSYTDFVVNIDKPYGSARSIGTGSLIGQQTVRNYREGTFPDVWKIGPIASKSQVWVRDFSCYCCPLACKKSGVVEKGAFAGWSHDGPEYETGVMLGSNLMISDLKGLLKEIFTGDDYGLDLISTGNVLGFLMEAYEKKCIDRNFLDGIDLTWGNVDGALQMIRKIAMREGVGDLCAGGVKKLAAMIGQGSETFAFHVKGLEMAGWNLHLDPAMGISYATCNRGACHLNGGGVQRQNHKVGFDTCCFCSRADTGINRNLLCDFLEAVTGVSRSEDAMAIMGERIYNLEKMFNYREGFRRIDDHLPNRFFDEPLTVGIMAGARLDKDSFYERLDNYYKERGWNPDTSRPSDETLERLGLSFTL